MAQLKLFQVYCIDANSLINLKRVYPRSMKVFSPIWEKIEGMIKMDLLVSHFEVYREIKEGNDEISKWATINRKIFKEPDDQEQIRNFEKVKEQYDTDYWERETNADRPWGDPWIIALSMAIKATIVTDENKEKGNRIPSVARQFQIASLNLLEFFKEIGIE